MGKFLHAKLLFSGLILLCISLEAFSQLYINEIMPANSTTIKDPDYGSSADWIEIFNGTAYQKDISGYYLTDNISFPQKWKFPANTIIPANGHILVWADDVNLLLHTNFKLSSSGETVALYDANTNLIDSVTYAPCPNDIPYGRTVDGEYTWGLLKTPTPGQSNTSDITKGYAPEVIFSKEAGFYSSNVSLALSTTLSGATIRYTTDGSTPTKNSTLYTGTITLAPTTRQRQFTEYDGYDDVTINARTVKARVFHNDYLPGRVVGNTYFINEKDFTLPVISITTDNDSMFGKDWGIYVTGNGNGLCGRGSTIKRNWNQAWERPVYFEYFDNNKKQQISQTCGASIMGGWSRMWDQKSFNIEADSKYDQIDRFNYKFFEHKNIDKFESIVLRNSGNDFDGSTTMMRDALTHALLRNQGIDIDYQEYSPAIVFINGEYWGIQNIRERLNKYYVEENHKNVDADNIDFLKNQHNSTYYYDCAPNYKINNIKEGDAIHYEALVEYMETHDLGIQSNYDYVKTQIDIDAQINYFIISTFVSNDDWPHNNTRYWRPRTDDGKWRWILFDTDFGWGIWNRSSTQPTLLRALGEANGYNMSTPPPAWSTVIFKNLIESDEYVQEMVQRYMAHISYTFNGDRIEQTAKQLASVIEPEIQDHLDRWGKHYTSWEDNVQAMIDWAKGGQYSTGRIEEAKEQVLDRFGYSTTHNLTVNQYGSGNVTVNSCKILPGVAAELVANIPVRLEAEASPGYKFAGWMKVTGPPTSTTIFNTGSTWKYNDKGIDLHSSNWKELSYDDNSWLSGVGRLGYGDAFTITELSYGPDKDNKYPCYYFRKKININDASALSSVIMSSTFDDGIVVYLNGTEVYRYNMTAGTTSYNQLATAGQNDAAETNLYDIYIPTDLFIDGENIIAVEIHQQSISTSTDMGFDMKMVSTSGLPQGTIVNYDETYQINLTSDNTIAAVFQTVQPIANVMINEFMASNSATIKDNAGEYEDWIEIYNYGTTSVNIGGCYFTDDLNNKTLYRIPTTHPDSTTIQPGKYLILWADKDLDQGILHLDFNLSATGESIGFYQPTGENMITLDEVTFLAQSNNISYGSFPNGSTTRQNLMPTPGAANIKLETIEDLVINEFVVGNNGSLKDEYGEFEDWIELFNAGTKSIDIGGLYISDDVTKPDKYRIPTTDPSKTTINPGEYLILWADKDMTQGVLHIDIGLSASGESVLISQNIGTGINIIDQYTYDSVAADIAYARIPNATGNFIKVFDATPNEENIILSPNAITGIFINEICSENGTILDNAGQKDDWIEIYNSNSTPVNIGGLFITDNTNDKTLWRIPSIYPDSTTIEAGGYLVLWADNDTKQGILHLGFKLSSDGEEIGLYQSVNNNLVTIDEYQYTTQYEDITYGRYTDGSSNFDFLSPTPNASNIKVDKRTIVCEIRTDKDTIDFVMNPDNDTYSIELESHTTKIHEVIYTSPYNNVVITATQPTMVQGGISTAEVVSIDGTITYTLNITKELSSDATLASISLSYGTLSPAFSPSEIMYNVLIDISQTPYLPVVSAETNDILSVSSISQAISLPGVATILVTAEDGTDKLYYIYFDINSATFDLITIGDDWKYNDKGISHDTVNWKSVDYDDSEWSVGKAMLGYGENQTTTISYGSDSDNKYPCYYFRKSFTIENLTSLSNYKMSIQKDDGAVVYLNGTEIFRMNMPVGDIIYEDFALETCADECETTFIDSIVDQSLFVEGENIIAVEIHQADALSTDLSFDFKLSTQRTLNSEQIVQTLKLEKGWNLISLYVNTYDMRPAGIFAAIMDKVDVIKTFDQSFMPGGINNNLAYLKDGKSYFIKMKSAAEVQITGSPLRASSITLNLTEGWNMLGYPSQIETSTSTTLNSIINKVRILKNETEYYSPSGLEYFNNCKNFVPGQGYIINMKTSANYTFPDIK